MARGAGLGVLAGAALGAVEMSARVLLDPDPSAARRAGGLVLYAAGLYGGAGLGLGAAAGLAAALVRSGRAGARGAAAAGTLVAGLAGLVLFALLGPRFSARELPIRSAAVLGIGLAALAAGLAVRSPVLWRARRPGAPAGPAPAAAGRWPRGLARVGALAGALLLLAGLLTPALARRAAGAAPAPLAPPPAPPPPHLVVVVVDTLRADVLSCYGGRAGLTPNVQRLAAEGIVFEQAVAAAPWTLPSVASILTSTAPREHGLLDFRHRLPDELEVLPEVLRRAGYHTRAAVGNVFVNRARGFARGFELFDQYSFDRETELLLARSVEELLRLGGPLRQVPRTAHPLLWPQRAFPFVTTRLAPDVDDLDLVAALLDPPLPTGRPLFLYAQLVAPHSPYLEHPAGFLKRWPALLKAQRERLWELYQGEVAHADRALGELLARLAQAGVLEDTIVVFTSDHGEEFQEHGGWEHGYGVFQEVVRVPLVVAGPGLARGLRVEEPVSLVDLASTLADLAGVARPPGFQGQSLAPLLRGEGAAGLAAGVFSEVASRILDEERDQFALVGGRYKVILRRSAAGETLETLVFDLDQDPGEERPLDPVPAEAQPLVEELARYAALVPARAADLDLDAEERDRMDALGYVDD